MQLSTLGASLCIGNASVYFRPSPAQRNINTHVEQDLKSLSATRQRLNLDLKDSQKGPQVMYTSIPSNVDTRDCP